MFDNFIGQCYSDVMDSMKNTAQQHGWRCISWPEGIGGVSPDDDCVIVYINNDIEQIIVSVAIPSP
jgi:hypothetical protein